MGRLERLGVDGVPSGPVKSRSSGPVTTPTSRAFWRYAVSGSAAVTPTAPSQPASTTPSGELDSHAGAVHADGVDVLQVADGPVELRVVDGVDARLDRGPLGRRSRSAGHGSVGPRSVLLALVERGVADLRTTRYGLDEINTVAERLENREIEGRAVITPP